MSRCCVCSMGEPIVPVLELLDGVRVVSKACFRWKPSLALLDSLRTSQKSDSSAKILASILPALANYKIDRRALFVLLTLAVRPKLAR